MDQNMNTNEQPSIASMERPSETPSNYSEQTASAEAVSPETPTEPLPGVISLIKSGYAIYRERIGALIGVSVLQMLAWGFILVPVTLFALLRSSVIVAVVVTLLSVLAVVWLYFWFMLAGMKIISGHAQRVSLRQALTSAFSEVPSFVWMIVIAFLIVIGVGALLTILSSAIIALLGVISGMHNLAVMIGGAAVVISWLVVGVLFSIWFVFSYWVFVDEDKRGIGALVASRELVRKDFGAIFWRLFAATFLVYLVYYISLVLNSLFLSGIVYSVVSILLYLASALFLIPLILSIVYEIFRSVKVRVGAEVQQNKKLHKYFMGYAVFGAVGVVLFIIMMLVMGAPMMYALLHV